jgi:hypothetical protein
VTRSSSSARVHHSVTVQALLNHVRALSTRFAHRHAGDPDEARAVEYIADTFRGAGLEPRIYEVPIMGWELESGPVLRLESPDVRDLECAPFIFSGSTPAQGLRGRLEYVGTSVTSGGFLFEKFAIVDNGGQWRGFVAGRDDGPACSQSGPPAGLAGNADTPTYTWPACIVGEGDLRLLKETWSRGVPMSVIYQATTRYRPDAISYTVEASVPGRDQPDEVVILGSHHDAQGAVGFPAAITSPGANDNASGVAIFLELARHYARNPARKTLSFVVFGGEERGLMLSREYARMLSETKRLDRVVAYLGIDQAAHGDVFRFLSSSREQHLKPSLDLRPLLTSAVEALRLTDRFTSYGPAPLHSGSDHWPFYFAGVPAFLTGWHPFPQYHRGDDTIDACDQNDKYLATLELTFSMIDAVAALEPLGPVDRGIFAGHVSPGSIVGA